MKKVLYTVLAVVALTLSACGSAGDATEDSSDTNTILVAVKMPL